MEHAFALAVGRGGVLFELLWGVEPHAIPKRRAAGVAGLSPPPLAPAFGVADGRRAAGACGRYTGGHVSWHSGVKNNGLGSVKFEQNIWGGVLLADEDVLGARGA